MIIDIHDVASLDGLAANCHHVASHGDTIGLFSGAWDCVHYYHILHLQMAKRLCNFLIIGVGTDRLVRHDKGKDRPIYPEHHRLGIINSICYVDACFLMDHEKDFGFMVGLIECFDNLVIFKNEDWLDKLNIIPGYKPDADMTKFYGSKDISDSLHGNVIIIPDVDNTSSTTDFIKKIRNSC